MFVESIIRATTTTSMKVSQPLPFNPHPRDFNEVLLRLFAPHNKTFDWTQDDATWIAIGVIPFGSFHIFVCDDEEEVGEKIDLLRVKKIQVLMNKMEDKDRYMKKTPVSSFARHKVCIDEFDLPDEFTGKELSDQVNKIIEGSLPPGAYEGRNLPDSPIDKFTLQEARRQFTVEHAFEAVASEVKEGWLYNTKGKVIRPTHIRIGSFFNILVIRTKLNGRTLDVIKDAVQSTCKFHQVDHTGIHMVEFRGFIWHDYWIDRSIRPSRMWLYATDAERDMFEKERTFKNYYRRYYDYMSMPEKKAMRDILTRHARMFPADFTVEDEDLLEKMEKKVGTVNVDKLETPKTMWKITNNRWDTWQFTTE